MRMCSECNGKANKRDIHWPSIARCSTCKKDFSQEEWELLKHIQFRCFGLFYTSSMPTDVRNR